MSKATDGLLDVILEKDALIAELMAKIAVLEAATLTVGGKPDA